jgi:DNA-binding transcriptional regulator YiaG
MSTPAIADSDLVMHLPCVRVSEDISLENHRLPRLDKKPPAVRKLTPEQQELIDIRKQCGLSQAQFAEALGIGFPRLSSYEHGRTDSIPDWIMQSAHGLAETHGTAQDAAQQRYAGLDMPEIVAIWAKRMDVPYDDNQRLAALLGTSVPTPDSLEKPPNATAHTIPAAPRTTCRASLREALKASRTYRRLETRLAPTKYQSLTCA